MSYDPSFEAMLAVFNGKSMRNLMTAPVAQYVHATTWAHQGRACGEAVGRWPFVFGGA